MRSMSIIFLLSMTLVNISPFARAKVSTSYKPKPSASKSTKPPVKSVYTPKQRAALNIVFTQLSNLDKAAHSPITKDDYKAKVDTAYHALLIPFFDLSLKTETVAHAKNSFQAYRDALTAWDEPVPYSEWDNIQDSSYVTPGIVKRYNIPADFLSSKKDLDAYDLEEYAHTAINNAIWKYAHEEYLQALSGRIQ